MRARHPAGRTPRSPEDLIPLPPPAVPTVVTARAESVQIRNVIRAAVAALDHVIDDQPATETSRRRAAIGCRTAVAIPLENCRSYSFPGLRAVVRIVRLRPLARSRCPVRRTECWWFDRHDTALRLSVYARINCPGSSTWRSSGLRKKGSWAFCLNFRNFACEGPMR
jgi:hypothetical protein